MVALRPYGLATSEAVAGHCINSTELSRQQRYDRNAAFYPENFSSNREAGGYLLRMSSLTSIMSKASLFVDSFFIPSLPIFLLSSLLR
jgi:hypothetical protein